MKGLSEYEVGMLASTMSPGSAAMMMGRSEAWVVRKRAEIEAAEKAPPEPVGIVETAAEPTPIPSAPKIAPPLSGRALAEHLIETTDETFAAIAARCGPPLAEVEALADGEQPELPLIPLAAEPYAAFHEEGRDPVPPRPFLRAAIEAVHANCKADPPKPELPEVPDRVMRFVRWFVAARWRIKEIAHLFDLDEPSLREALRRG